MKRALKIMFWLSIPVMVWLGLRIDAWWMQYVAGDPAMVTNDIGKPYAVITIDYGEPVKGFIENEFYVLKVLKIRGNKVDYGFCPIAREKFYKPEADDD